MQVLSGADALCQTLGGAPSFRAFIGAPGHNAIARFPAGARGFVRADHRPFTTYLDPASSWLYHPALLDAILHASPDALLLSNFRAIARQARLSGENAGFRGSAFRDYVSNRCAPERTLPPGIYGVSNHLLDTPWPKLSASKQRFAAALTTLPDESAFFSLLADDEIVPDDALPATGVPLPWERLLSAVFVRSPDYGTRASTVLLVAADGRASLIERSFGPAGSCGESRLTVRRDPHC